ncbi:MAG: hypothetical protein GC152_15095 [Alphaproteobacteria bacterium]|nr:hypothetical protein [Alphaproteobacteria bacterium]
MRLTARLFIAGLAIASCLAACVHTDATQSDGTRSVGLAGRYVVTIRPANLRRVEVTAEINLAGDVLAMDWMGADHLPARWATFVDGLKAANATTGAPIAVSPLGEGRWRLDDVSAGQKVRIDYIVCVDHDLIDWPGGHDEAAYVIDEGLFGLGATFFIAEPDAGANRRYEVAIRGAPNDWIVTTPWAVAPDGARTARGTDDLVRSPIFVGRGEAIRLATGGFEFEAAAGEAFAPALPTIADQYRRIAPAGNDLFRRPPGAKFVVIGNVAPQNNVYDPYFSGGVVNRAITIIAPEPPTTATLGALQHILTHEFLHLWNGVAMRPRAYDEGQWFMEGVTEYATIRLEQRLGDRSGDDVLNGGYGLSFWYGQYRAFDGTASPEEAGREKDDNFPIIYGGGLAFATALDIEIVRATNGEASLVDFLRALATRTMKDAGAGDPGGEWTLDDLRAVARGLAGARIDGVFDAFLGSHGGGFDLAPYLAAVGLSVETDGEGDVALAPVAAPTLDQAALRRRWLDDGWADVLAAE